MANMKLESMGKRGRRSPPVRIEEENGEVVVKRGNTVVARGVTEALHYLFTCPKCGAKATAVARGKMGYLYALHPIPRTGRGDNKHVWFISTITPVTEKLAQLIEKKEYTLSGEDRSYISRLLQQLDGAPATVKGLLEALANAEAVTVKPYW